MNTLRTLTLTLLAAFSTSLCHAHKFAIDSIDAITKEYVKVIALNIGDAAYHKYGKVIIEQRGNKYSITFPYFVYTGPPPINVINGEEDTIRKWTPIVLQLDNGEIVRSQTVEDINCEWHYLWHYADYSRDKGPLERTYIYI